MSDTAVQYFYTPWHPLHEKIAIKKPEEQKPIEWLDRAMMSVCHWDLMGWLCRNRPPERYVRLTSDLHVQVSDDQDTWSTRGVLEIGEQWGVSKRAFWKVREVGQDPNIEKFCSCCTDHGEFMSELWKLGTIHPYCWDLMLDRIEAHKAQDDTWSADIWYVDRRGRF